MGWPKSTISGPLQQTAVRQTSVIATPYVLITCKMFVFYAYVVELCVCEWTGRVAGAGSCRPGGQDPPPAASSPAPRRARFSLRPPPAFAQAAGGDPASGAPLLPPGRLYLLSSRPQAPHGGGVPARGCLWRRGERVRGRGGPGRGSGLLRVGTGTSQGLSPSCLPGRSFPSILLLFIHLMYQITPYYRGVPSLLLIKKPGAIEAL